jgi:uncharacterized membrane protein YoaT (DUF817 family)
MAFPRELLAFGIKNAKSCVFAGSFFTLLALSNLMSIPGLARYDFIFLGTLFIQAILLLAKIESKNELKVILLFHIIGFCLEIYKVQPELGHWSYPEDAFFKILGVPLYSGFMYSAVASYMSQAWKHFKLKLSHYPPYYLSLPLAALIYANFFTNEFLPDARMLLIPAIFLLFAKTSVYYTPYRLERRMPLTLSFFLIACFIWIAENISTFLGAWQYPHQAFGWNLVSLHVLSSWFLLVILSLMIVADLKHLRAHQVHLSNHE